MFSALWQEICNDIVAAGGRFVNGEMLFQMELPEAVEALRKCIKVAVTFISSCSGKNMKRAAVLKQGYITEPYFFDANRLLFYRAEYRV